jgi:hypothetical protein
LWLANWTQAPFVCLLPLTPAQKAVQSTQAEEKACCRQEKKTVAAAKKTQKVGWLCDSDSDDFDFNSDEENRSSKPVVAAYRA